VAECIRSCCNIFRVGLGIWISWIYKNPIAVARYAGLTGSPDESGVKRREKGLAKAGNARVRRGLILYAPVRVFMGSADEEVSPPPRIMLSGLSPRRKGR